MPNFLGERSHELGKRHTLLAHAEFLEFENARDLFQKGSIDLYHKRYDQAIAKFHSCLRKINGISFYQSLAGNNRIDLDEYNKIKANSLFNLVKSHIESGKEWTEYEAILLDYLNLSLDVSRVQEAEKYLISKKIMSRNLNVTDIEWNKLYFQLLLYLKQNRYRDIVELLC